MRRDKATHTHLALVLLLLAFSAGVLALVAQPSSFLERTADVDSGGSSGAFAPTASSVAQPASPSFEPAATNTADRSAAGGPKPPDPTTQFAVSGLSDVVAVPYSTDLTGFYLEQAVGAMNVTIFANSPEDELTLHCGAVLTATVVSNDPLTSNNLPFKTMFTDFWQHPICNCNVTCTTNCTTCKYEKPTQYYLRFTGSKDSRAYYQWSVPSHSKDPHPFSGLNAEAWAHYKITDRSSSHVTVQWQAAEPNDGTLVSDLEYAFACSDSARVNPYTVSGFNESKIFVGWTSYPATPGPANSSRITVSLDTGKVSKGTHRLSLAVRDSHGHLATYYPVAEEDVTFVRSTSWFFYFLWVAGAVLLACLLALGYFCYRRRLLSRRASLFYSPGAAASGYMALDSGGGGETAGLPRPILGGRGGGGGSISLGRPKSAPSSGLHLQKGMVV